MKKTLLACLGLAMASTLSGCMLYFGEEHHGDMCPPGTYESYDDWGNPVCVPGGGDGYYCSTDQQCASGCYCDETSGTCAEAGFCSTDADCGAGMSCDCSNSCVPAGTETRSCGQTCFETGCPIGMSCANDGVCLPNGPTCTSDTECAAGCYCGPSGSCAETAVCTSNADCPTDQHCDTDRSTCVPGAPPPPPPPPAPSSAGEITCAFGAPTCPAGQVPLILDGCWTGTCAAYETCTAAPTCAVLNTENICLGRADCTAVYSGQNCTRTDGSACTMGDTGCTCQTFSFDHCRAD